MNNSFILLIYNQVVAFGAMQTHSSFPSIIYTPLIPRLDGGPYYPGEWIEHEMVIRVLGRVPQACGS